jgi:hypothetical protein
MTPNLTRIPVLVRRTATVVAIAGAALLAGGASASAALPAIKHVFVLIDENESASTTFGVSSPAPYLSKTLVSQGAFIPNYYGIGHASLDNYIAMVSGQAPNAMTSADCPTYSDFVPPTSIDSNGQETGAGCVYPADVPTLMSQLDSAGLTWRGYMDSMGADPARETATCGHPTLGGPDGTQAGETSGEFDEYATRHDPFMYFHYVIDNTTATGCGMHVVNLSQLPTDLASVSTTPNYTFITPDLCDDGHDATGPTCPGGGGLAQADAFLQHWVPIITSSPAYKQDGLLIITFDEGVGDSTACCGQVAPGGGVVGAVLLSPFITAGTVTTTAYNHYSMLGSVEDIFGLPRLAAATGTTAFGTDIFGTTTTTTPPPSPLPVATAPRDSQLKLTPASFTPQPAGHTRKGRGTTIGYHDTQAATTKLTVVRKRSGYRKGHGTCRVLSPGHKRPKHSKACTALKTIGSFSHVDKAGANSITFTGRLGGHALAAGSYLLQATPKLGSLTGKTTSASFRVR